MKLPNFIICGTQKGGTSALYYFLKEHPEIYLSPKKEVHYFDLNYQKGLKWYEKHFKGASSKYKAIGEASPLYMYLEEVPERIHETLPDAKLIFILRNPVDRAYSHYWHEIRLGYEWLPFEEAIKKEKERLAAGTIFDKQHCSYLDRGKYIKQLKRYRKYFSKDQMLILISEELKNKPENVLKRVFEFLDVNTQFRIESFNNKNIGKRPRFLIIQRLIVAKLHTLHQYYIPEAYPLTNRLILLINALNLIPGYPKMNPQTRKKLSEYFKPYNKKLEDFLGHKLEQWYTKSIARRSK
ncbi:sulfotransferase [Archaeoglobales archaeon ex4484_92]|nr:MAG: sulfotransferase [Archaeoglobales archaeon ex4484_92]